MPTIELLGDKLDAARVWSLMCHPTDDSKRARLLAAAQRLHEEPTNEAARRIFDGEIRNSEKAAISGEIIVLIAAMTVGGMADASVNRAVYLVKRRFEIARDDGRVSPPVDGDRAESYEFDEDNDGIYSERSYRTYLADYRPVAHLWAAFLLLEHEVPAWHIPHVLEDHQVLRRFLEWAAWFLDLCSAPNNRNKKAAPPLDRQTAYAPSIAIKPTAPDLAYHVQSLEAELRGYSAYLKSK